MKPGPNAVRDKAFLERLERLLRDSPPMALAFSGGLDSRFLAHMAFLAGKGAQTHLFHIQGPHVPKTEGARALNWAGSRGLSLVSLNSLDIQEVRANNKLHLGAEVSVAVSQRLTQAVSAQGLAAPRLLVFNEVSGHCDR